jgi:hypothetical protein
MPSDDTLHETYDLSVARCETTCGRQASARSKPKTTVSQRIGQNQRKLVSVPPYSVIRHALALFPRSVLVTCGPHFWPKNLQRVICRECFTKETRAQEKTEGAIRHPKHSANRRGTDTAASDWKWQTRHAMPHPDRTEHVCLLWGCTGQATAGCAEQPRSPRTRHHTKDDKQHSTEPSGHDTNQRRHQYSSLE